jgi:predicted  nucleic acid-binding Zn-ribbon protein
LSDHPTKKQDQVRLLVALQDLDHMIKDAEDAKHAAKMLEMGFPQGGIEELRKARTEITQHVKPQLLTRYQRVSASYERTVVPVVSDLCTGCLTKVPTSFRYEKNAVMTCENCGRILYFI